MLFESPGGAFISQFKNWLIPLFFAVPRKAKNASESRTGHFYFFPARRPARRRGVSHGTRMLSESPGGGFHQPVQRPADSAYLMILKSLNTAPPLVDVVHVT